MENGVVDDCSHVAATVAKIEKSFFPGKSNKQQHNAMLLM